MANDFVKGASGPESVYDTSPSGLGLSPSYLGGASASAAAASGSGAVLDYVEFTSPVSVTATTEATANTVVASNAVTYDGVTVVVVEFFCPTWSLSTTSAELFLYLYDGGTSGGFLDSVVPASTNRQGAIRLSRRLTPSAAAHTYSIRGALSAAGTATITAGAGGTGVYFPGFIRVVRA